MPSTTLLCTQLATQSIVGTITQDVGMVWMCCGVIPILFGWFWGFHPYMCLFSFGKLFCDLYNIESLVTKQWERDAIDCNNYKGIVDKPFCAVGKSSRFESDHSSCNPCLNVCTVALTSHVTRSWYGYNRRQHRITNNKLADIKCSESGGINLVGSPATTSFSVPLFLYQWTRVY